MTSLQPLHDFVAIEMKKPDTETASGIVIVNKTDTTSQQGTAIAVGPGAIVDGKREPLVVKVGDEVLYNKGTGSIVELDKKQFLFIRERDLMGVIR